MVIHLEIEAYHLGYQNLQRKKTLTLSAGYGPKSGLGTRTNSTSTSLRTCDATGFKVHKQTQSSHKPNTIVVFVKVDESFMTISLSRSSEVRVKVT